MKDKFFKAFIISLIFFYLSALTPVNAEICGCDGEFICYCCLVSHDFDGDVSFSKCIERKSDESNTLPFSIVQYSCNRFFLLSDDDCYKNEQASSFCGYKKRMIKPPAAA